MVSAKILSAVVLTATAVRTSRKGAAQDNYSPYDGKPFLQFITESKSERDALADRIVDLNCQDMGGGEGSAYMGAICDMDASITLQKEMPGKVQVMTADAGGFFRETSGGVQQYKASRSGELTADFYTQWRNFDDRMARVSQIVASSGNACKLYSIGTSYEGRNITGVRLTGAGYSSGDPRVVVGFQQHAREWITGMTGVYSVETACNKAASDPSWLSGMEVIFMPCANPDGAIYSEVSSRMHRKNMRVNSGSSCRGVDLNRNWGVDWNGGQSTSTSKCSDTYVGTAAFSEPETQAQKAVLDESFTTIHLDIHAFSQLILRPWSYTNTPHPRKAEIDVVGKKMHDAVQKTHGATYKYGGPEVIYPASGAAPDYVSTKGGFGYCYELRPASQWNGGFSPPASEILPAAEETWAGIDVAITWAKDPTATPAPTPGPPPTPEPVNCGAFCSSLFCWISSCSGCPYC